MGQRHQIYFVLPARKSLYEVTSEKPRIIGLHHQWLYGSLPVRKVEQFLQFVAAGVADESGHSFTNAGVPEWMVASHHSGEHTDDETVRTLHAIYGLDLADGSYCSLHTLDAETCANPLRADNNDGITIIDLREPANPRFAFMFLGWGDPDAAQRLSLRPLSAADYLGAYYEREATDDDRYKLAPDGAWDLAHALDARYRHLTLAEVRKLFPAMFPARKA